MYFRRTKELRLLTQLFKWNQDIFKPFGGQSEKPLLREPQHAASKQSPGF